MQNVLLVAYLLIVLALIAVILLQRSEGGGLGMGGNAGGLMTVRGSANLLTRTTAILAALFFATAIGLTILSELDRGTSAILDNAVTSGPQPSTVLDALSQMQGDTSSSAPAAVSSAAPTDPGLALPVTPAPSDVTAPSSSAAPPASSAAPAPSSAPAPSDAAPAASSAPAQ
ncbi:MAG TPA: preprotein translocase subunit SecG [Devosia sp.]|jgi:preprotein translocase subunit SecG|nr:preprotein translocase subunit SecG [Devosia sp.]